MARRRYQHPTPKLREGKNSKTWYFSYRQDVIKDGHIVREQVSDSFPWDDFKTQRLAQREVDRRMSEINDENYRARPVTTFGEFSARWETAVLKLLKPSSQQSAGSLLKCHLLPYFGEVKMKELNAMMIQEFASSYSASPETVKNCIAWLRTMYKTAQDWDCVAPELDPFKRLKLRKGQKKEARFFTEQQMEDIINAAQEPYKTFFWLAKETGLRAGELCGLRASDVDFEACTVSVRQSVWNGKEQAPKTVNAVRRFSIGKPLCEILQFMSANREGLIFVNGRGNALRPNIILQRVLHPILERLGIPKAGLHAFRHGNATMMDERNVPLKTRQKRLGHSNPLLTLDRYTHQVDVDDRNAAESLARVQ